jgi:hypothetical protein
MFATMNKKHIEDVPRQHRIIKKVHREVGMPISNNL